LLPEWHPPVESGLPAPATVATRKGKGRRAPCGRGSPSPSGRGGRSSSRGRHAGSAPSTASRPLRKSRGGALRGLGVGRVRGPGRPWLPGFEREGVSGSSETCPVRFAGRSRPRPGTGQRSGWFRRRDSSPCLYCTEHPRAQTTVLTWVGSPREHRVALWRKRRGVATDSSMDQGLEAGGDATGCGSPSSGKAWAVAPSPPDGEKASAAVTRYGCRRGESSEGWTRHGNGGVRHIARRPRAAVNSSGRSSRTEGGRRAGQSPETWRTP